jgi:hypothetical protein
MRQLSERDVRSSFVNCTKGEVKRLVLPNRLLDSMGTDLDFLGWRDPASPERAYLVAEYGEDLVGIALRRATPSGAARRSMCSLCLTTHSGDGVSLMTARKAGRRDNSVGAYMCSDLACSLYLRGRKDPGPGGRIHESLALSEKIDRTMANLTAFITKVMS